MAYPRTVRKRPLSRPPTRRGSAIIALMAPRKPKPKPKPKPEPPTPEPLRHPDNQGKDIETAWIL